MGFEESIRVCVRACVRACICVGVRVGVGCAAVVCDAVCGVHTTVVDASRIASVAGVATVVATAGSSAAEVT